MLRQRVATVQTLFTVSDNYQVIELVMMVKVTVKISTADMAIALCWLPAPMPVNMALMLDQDECCNARLIPDIYGVVTQLLFYNKKMLISHWLAECG